VNKGNPAKPVACLFELSGERAGAAHVLKGEAFRIGADSENDLVLKDTSVALYQVEIHTVEHGHLLKNLSSQGNAYLNGEPFEEALLQKGDILTLGEAMIRYVAGSEALTQEELWRPVGGLPMAGKTRPLVRWKAVLAAVLGILALGIFFLLMLRVPGQKEEEFPATADPGLADLKVMDRREVQNLYERGTAYLVARRWDEALVIFEQLREGAPSFKDAEQLYQQAQQESRNADVLNLGKGLLLEGEWAEASERLGVIPKESLLFREKEQLLREINLLQAGIRLEKARAYFAQDEWLAAKQESEGILADFPDHPEATILRNQAARMLSQVKQTWHLRARVPPAADSVIGRVPAGPGGVPSSGDKGGRIGREDPAGDGRAGVRSEEPAAVDAGGKAGRVEVSKPSPPDPPMGSPAWSLNQAVSAYRKGDVDQALRCLAPLLKGVADRRVAGQAREMADNLQGAMSCFQQAKTLQGENRVLEALEMWEEFLKRDRRISGPLDGVFSQRASASLASLYSQRGDQAFSAGDLTRAFRFWGMAGRVNPQDENARRGLSRLSKEAQRLFREGYSLQDINPTRAVEMWKLVMQIVPPDHPYYQEARRQVGRLGARP